MLLRRIALTVTLALRDDERVERKKRLSRG